MYESPAQGRLCFEIPPGFRGGVSYRSKGIAIVAYVQAATWCLIRNRAALFTNSFQRDPAIALLLVGLTRRGALTTTTEHFSSVNVAEAPLDRRHRRAIDEGVSFYVACRFSRNL